MKKRINETALFDYGTVGVAAIARMRARLQDQENRETAERERRALDVAHASEDRPILNPQHWIENEFYAGDHAVMPGGNTFPILRDLFVEVYEKGVHLILLKGAIGYGKSHFARLVNKFCLYLLTCYANPHRAFVRHLVESDPIVMINMNVNKEKAKDAYFASFRRSVLGTAYFQQVATPRPNLLNKIEIPSKNILCHFAGASVTAAESENPIVVVLDEINLYDEVEHSKRSEAGDKYDEAEIVYTAADRRQDSRFMNPDGTYPDACKMILLCRETYPKSFMNRMAEKVREREWNKVSRKTGKQKAIIIDMAEWESKPEHYYITEGIPPEEQWFWIVTATRTETAYIVEDSRRALDVEVSIEKLKKGGADEDEIPKLIKVPRMGGDYVAKAKDNMEGFLRDVCGIPTEAISIFFKDRNLLFEAVRKPGQKFPWFDDMQGCPSEVCVHPFTSDATDFGEGIAFTRERVAERATWTDVDGVTSEYWRPIVAPTAPRFLHIDMGLSHDHAGIGIVCVPGWKSLVRNEIDESGKLIAVPTVAPWIWVDLALECVPPPGGQIPFSGIKGVVRSFKRLGFRLVYGSADGFQSDQLIQELNEEMGIESGRLSMDMSPDSYHEWHRAYREERFIPYRLAEYEAEARSLERHVVKRKVKGKTILSEYIDHPPRGKKDLTDAVAGATANAARLAKVYTNVARAPEPLKPEKKTALASEHGKMRDAREAMKEGRLEDMFDMGKGRGRG